MDVYARLGVRPIVNARGMNTMASGSLMPKPVLDAMTRRPAPSWTWPSSTPAPARTSRAWSASRAPT